MWWWLGGFWGALGQWCLVCVQRVFCLPWNFTNTNSPVCVLVCECLFGTDTQRHHGPKPACGQCNKISLGCCIRHTYINLCLHGFWQKVQCPHVALSLHGMLAHVVRLRLEVQLLQVHFQFSLGHCMVTVKAKEELYHLLNRGEGRKSPNGWNVWLLKPKPQGLSLITASHYQEWSHAQIILQIILYTFCIHTASTYIYITEYQHGKFCLLF